MASFRVEKAYFVPHRDLVVLTDSVQKVGRASLRGDYRWANLETYWAEIAAQYVYALAACIGDYPNCESDYVRTESFEVAFGLAEPTGRRVSRVLREWYGTLGGA